MSANQAVVLYNSVYYHGVDPKRRVQIPAKWRPAQEDLQFTLILWPKSGFREEYILVLPPEPMATLFEKLKAMPYSDPQAEALRRRLGRHSDQAPLDKSGRICLPDLLSKGAGIDREAVLVGSWDRFEIWSPERYEAAIKSDDALASEAFKMI